MQYGRFFSEKNCTIPFVRNFVTRTVTLEEQHCPPLLMTSVSLHGVAQPTANMAGTHSRLHVITFQVASVAEVCITLAADTTQNSPR
jgi:hypothetical protein